MLGQVLRKSYERNPAAWQLDTHNEDMWNILSFMEHPVTQRVGHHRAKPIGLYQDKVALHKHEGILDGEYRMIFLLNHFENIMLTR